MKEIGRRRLICMLAGFTFILACQGLKAQQHPPRPVRIDVTTQTLSFGAFYTGVAGGSIIIDPSGVRTSTGGVILLNMGYSFSSALFEVHAHPGTIISILNGPDAVLTGSSGGTMTMHPGASNPVSPFVVTTNFNIPVNLYIGGTLNVGPPASNPPGNYTGTFSITLVQE